MQTRSMGNTLLSKKIALPVFASDALSSVAYAPDEVLLTLGLAGIAASGVSLWVGCGVLFVLAIVVLSYRQTVHAYPSGGGDYEVAKENLGNHAALGVASALLIDYVLTVAVSISSGAQYLTTAVPALFGYEVPLAVAIVTILALLNLRGMRESGTAFAIPTYIYMLAIGSLGIFGLYQELTGSLKPAVTAAYDLAPAAGYDAGLMGLAGFFLILRAFSSGCAALTGVEAISNGVPAFQKPKSRNAATTLTLLGLISAIMMMTILHLARVTGIKIPEDMAQLSQNGHPVNVKSVDPVIGQLAASIFSEIRPMFYLVTMVTGLILLLAANTAFNGFPQLASVLSRDSFLPRQLYKRGDRLSYSNGIIVLAVAAIALIVVFDAQTTRLIQMYIIGVFISFTTSQAGMIRHWNRMLRLCSDRKQRSSLHRSRAVNLVGLVITSAVLIIVTITKFTHGAWLALLLMFLVYLMMGGIRKHYSGTNQDLHVQDWDQARALPSRVHALVLVSRMDQPTMRAIGYAQATNPSTINLVSVDIESESTKNLKNQWENSAINVPLTVLASPFRDITGPVIQHVRSIRRRSPRDLVTVYIPYFLVKYFWEQALHNHSATRLRRQLQHLPGVIVVMVPWNLDDRIDHYSRQRGIQPLAAPEYYSPSSQPQIINSGIRVDPQTGAFFGQGNIPVWRREVAYEWSALPEINLVSGKQPDPDLGPAPVKEGNEKKNRMINRMFRAKPKSTEVKTPDNDLK